MDLDILERTLRIFNIEDLATLLTPKSPIKLEDFIGLPNTGKLVGKASNKKIRREVQW